MVAPVTPNITVTLQDITTASQQPDVTTSAVQDTAPPPALKSAAPQQNSQDTVALSSTSLAMSKALNESQNNNNQNNTEKIKPAQATQPEAEESKTDITNIKRYPPFMGDASQLKALKQYSPTMYREILRMIVPPPIDLSYSDLQMLKGYTQDKPVS